MDPLTLALIAAGGTAIGGIPDIKRSQYEKNQADELKKLKRRQELGLLGLSDAERRDIDNQMRGRSDQSEAFAAAERSRLTGESSQFGQELLAAEMGNEAAQRQQQAISESVLSANLAKENENIQLIRDLEAAQAETKRRRQEALVAPFSAAAETVVSGMAIDKLLQLPPQQAIPQMQKDYGLTKEEAAAFLGGVKVPELQTSSILDYSSISNAMGQGFSNTFASTGR